MLSDLPPDVYAIVQNVIDLHKLDEREFFSSSRRAAVAHHRQTAMSLARDLTDRPLEEIGRLFGGRDHTTVMHACRVARNRDPKMYDKLQERLADILQHQREVAIEALGVRAP